MIINQYLNSCQKIFLTTFIFLALLSASTASVLAQVVPLGPLTETEEETGKKDKQLVNCFDFYQFQKINISFAPQDKTGNEFIPNETLKLAGTVENQTEVAIVSGQIKYRLVKVNQNEKIRRNQGDDILDEGILLGEISLAPQEIKEVSVFYQLPKVLLSGGYRLNFYFTQNNQFDWAGLFYSDDVVGSFLPLNINTNGLVNDLPFFDRSKTQVNGKKHNHIGFISTPFEKNKEVTIQTALVNPSNSAFTGLVTNKLFYWDQQSSGNLLKVEKEAITLASFETKPVFYTIDQTEESVYFLSQTFQTIEPKTGDSYKTLVNTRIGTSASKGRLNAIGLSRFPVEQNGSTVIYICFHNTSTQIFQGTIRAELRDEKNNLIDTLTYQGEMPESMQALTKEITFESAPAILTLSAQITNQQGEITDQSTLIYDREKFAREADQVKPSSPQELYPQKERKFKKINFILSYLLIVIAILGISILIYYFRKKTKPSSLALLLLIGAGFLLYYPSKTHAFWSRSQTWSTTDSIEMRTDTAHSGGNVTNWLHFKADYVVNINYTVVAPVEDNQTINCGDTISLNLNKDGSISATGGAQGTPKIYFQSMPPIPAVCDPETAPSCRYCDPSQKSCLYPGSPGTINGSCCNQGAITLSNDQFSHLRTWGLDPENIFDNREQVQQHEAYMSVTPYGAIGVFIDPIPTLQLTSDNPEVISCNQDYCIAKDNGTAKINIKLSSSTAKVLGAQVCFRDDDYYEDKCSVITKTKTYTIEPIDLDSLTLQVRNCEVSPTPTFTPECIAPAEGQPKAELVFDAQPQEYNWTIEPPKYGNDANINDVFNQFSGQTFSANKNPYGIEVYVCESNKGQIKNNQGNELDRFTKRSHDICITHAEANHIWPTNIYPNSSTLSCHGSQFLVDGPPQSEDRRVQTRNIPICTTIIDTPGANPHLDVNINFEFRNYMNEPDNEVVLAGRSDPHNSECQGFPENPTVDQAVNLPPEQISCYLYFDDFAKVSVWKVGNETNKQTKEIKYTDVSHGFQTPALGKPVSINDLFVEGEGNYKINIKLFDNGDSVYGAGDIWLTWKGAPAICPTTTLTQTPAPSPTPTPTLTLTPIPSPTPTLWCDCNETEYAGEFKPGGKVTFTTYAVVPNPDINKAEVLNMVYHVNKGGRYGKQIAQSEEITAEKLEKDTDNNLDNNLDRYKTSWTFKIPETGAGEVEYYLWVKINCGYTQADQKTASIAYCPNQLVIVQGSQDRKVGFFDTILLLFAKLFVVQTVEPTPSPTPLPTAVLPPTVTPFATVFAPTTALSLQLGTFIPPTPEPKVEKGCTWLRFWIKY